MRGIIAFEEFLLSTLAIIVLGETISGGASIEYCQLETFHPQCLKNEVIAIGTAIYGRHRVGKCITDKESSFARDMEYFGCHANVVHQMNSKCSGKRECEVRIPDAELEQTRTCLPGLQMFLEVTHRCLEIVEAERSCNVLVTTRRLHLTDIQHNVGGVLCGTKNSPWLLEAPAGQRINLGLLDFTLKTANVSSLFAKSQSTEYNPVKAARLQRARIDRMNSVDCASQWKPQFGYIIDKTAARAPGIQNISICGGHGTEAMSHDNIYMSHSNVIELVLSGSGGHVNDGPKFLLSFEAVGCTNLVPPEDAWVKRQDDKITIGCYTSRQTWQLRCQDGKWVGVVSNCKYDQNLSSSAVEVTFHETKGGILANYDVAGVVAIGFVGLAACLIIVCTGIVFLHRLYAKFPSKTCLKPALSNVNFEPMGHVE